MKTLLQTIIDNNIISKYQYVCSFVGCAEQQGARLTQMTMFSTHKTTAKLPQAH